MSIFILKKVKALTRIGINGNMKFELLESGRSAVLAEPFMVLSSKRKPITVPKGFKTDFASVPRFFWRILPPWGKYSEAAVVHDFLYSIGSMTRLLADKEFKYLMMRIGVSWWKRNVMYLAVRMFGYIAWKMHRSGGNVNA